MPKHVSWITAELAYHYPKADFTKGVDLNRNGRLEKSELITDANKNGIAGDKDDWIAFVKRNSKILGIVGGIFDWHKTLKPDNPIHDVVQLELDVAPNAAARLQMSSRAQGAYRNLNAVVAMLKKCLAAKTGCGSKRYLSPRDKLDEALSVLKYHGYAITKASSYDAVMFSGAMNAKALGPYTLSLALLAIGHEMGWPLRLVLAGDTHAFVRWDGGKNARMNYDGGAVHSDAYYLADQNITRSAVKKGAYLKSLDGDELYAHALGVRSYIKVRRGDHASALADAVAAIKLDRKSVIARAMHGMALTGLKRYPKAFAAFRAALGIAPQSQNALFGRSNAYLQTKKYALAIRDLNRIITLNPGAHAYGTRAMVRYEQKDYAGAIKDLDAALRMASHPRFLSLRGWCKLKNADYQGARDDFTRAIIAVRMSGTPIMQMITVLPELLRGRAEANIELRKYRDALADLMRLRRSGGEDARSLFLAGRAYEGLNDHKAALSALDKAVKNNAKFRDAYMVRGRVRLALKKREGAFLDFTEAIGLDPKKADAYIARGEILSAMKKHREAVKDFSAAIAADRTSDAAYFQRGLARLGLGKRIEAMADFSAAIALRTKEPLAYYHRGVLFVERKNYRSAVGDLRAAIALKPRHADSYYYRGLAFNALGDKDAAMKDFDAAITLGTKHAPAYYERGTWRASVGQYAKACTDFEKAIKLDPANEARYRLALADAKASLGTFGSAARNYQRTQKLDPKLGAVRRRVAMGLTPELSLDGQFRYGVGGNGGIDGRTSINATWYLANLYRSLNLGLKMGFGYAGSPDHNAVDLEGSLALINQFSRSNLAAEAGAGYSFLVNGDDAQAATRSGGYFRYGLRYDYRISEKLLIGASLSLQHEMKDPKRFAVVPGLEATFNLW